MFGVGRNSVAELTGRFRGFLKQIVVGELSVADYEFSHNYFFYSA